MKLQAHGIETDLPLGWEGRIAMRHPSAPPGESHDGDATLPSEPDVAESTDDTAPRAPESSEGAVAAPFGAMSAPEGSEEPLPSNGANRSNRSHTSEAPTHRAPLIEPTSTGEQHFPVVHLANFPLPEDRGDFGSGAVDIMTANDILLALVEFGPECVNTPLFAPRDFPTRLTPHMFSGSALQRSHEGQAGCQIFFTHANRAFCLYTVLGRQSSASRVLPQANTTLTATRIAPR